VPKHPSSSGGARDEEEALPCRVQSERDARGLHEQCPVPGAHAWVAEVSHERESRDKVLQNALLDKDGVSFTEDRKSRPASPKKAKEKAEANDKMKTIFLTICLQDNCQPPYWVDAPLYAAL